MPLHQGIWGDVHTSGQPWLTIGTIRSMHLEGDVGSHQLHAVPAPRSTNPAEPLRQGDYLVTAFRADGDVDYYRAREAGRAAALATELAGKLGPTRIRVQRVAAEVDFSLVPRWRVHVTSGRSLNAW
jgi:hypothetical protein